MHGKWLASIEKSIFIDSKKFFTIYFDMITERFLQGLRRSMNVEATNLSLGSISHKHFMKIQRSIRVIQHSFREAESE